MYNTEFVEKLRQIYNNESIENILMSKHTSFRVGGPADFLVCPQDINKLISTVALCREFHINFLIIGNGSNLLVTDEGFSGVVIKLKSLKNVEIKDDCIIAEAGVMLPLISKLALENSLSGLEFAGGIPGTIGGAVYMNAGAYNGDMSKIVKEVHVINKDGDILVLNNEDMLFGYRKSMLMENEYIVIKAVLKLNSLPKEEIESLMNEFKGQRISKQPLNFPSAGSTFKRPEGHFAAKLIQDAGLKGYSIGGAEVSEKHSGFIINKGNATAKNILDLISYIKDEVYSKFQVELHTEVKIIGR